LRHLRGSSKCRTHPGYRQQIIHDFTGRVGLPSTFAVHCPKPPCRTQRPMPGENQGRLAGRRGRGRMRREAFGPPGWGVRHAPGDPRRAGCRVSIRRTCRALPPTGPEGTSEERPVRSGVRHGSNSRRRAHVAHGDLGSHQPGAHSYCDCPRSRRPGSRPCSTTTSASPACDAPPNGYPSCGR